MLFVLAYNFHLGPVHLDLPNFRFVINFRTLDHISVVLNLCLVEIR